ncbi:DUF4124 domain-containing protein [Kineobactrum sediminis]|uniref:DUF4124 domain-containing protein n=2 Tax=Kineobactrum sediminis TaxID=1905677 RepID=A0A2N5XZZ4_9GAMM|nr:DUF4124 domain-containing protein [Kineobactrum sediminis]
MIVLLAAGSVQVAAADAYYRWLDDRGIPVHSDRPPAAGIDYEVISSQSGLKRVVPAEQGAVPKEVEPRVGNEFETVDSRSATKDTMNAEYCQRARENLDTLQISKGGRIRVRNDQGELRYLDEEQVAGEKRIAEEAIKLYCD